MQNQGAPEQCFDIAWESSSGDALCVYGSGTNQYYREWNGSTWGSETQARTLGQAQSWVCLASDPRPSSNYIGMTVQDTGRDWNVNVWDGSSWGSNPGQDGTIETYANGRTLDLAWESRSGKLVVAGRI